MSMWENSCLVFLVFKGAQLCLVLNDTLLVHADGRTSWKPFRHRSVVALIDASKKMIVDKINLCSFHQTTFEIFKSRF